jgi:hypothetical protein
MGETTSYDAATYPSNFKNILPPKFCDSTCTNYTLQTIDEQPIYFNLSSTFDSFNLTNLTDLSKEGIHSVYFVAQRSTRSNCPYIYKAFDIEIKNPTIIMPADIPDVIFSPNLTTRNILNSTDNQMYSQSGFFFDPLEYF